MKGFREIKRRMKAVQSTAKITRAMQLVASSKMRFTQKAALNMRPYSRYLGNLATAIIHFGEKFNHDLITPREVKTRGIILVSTDKGLCGSLNQNIFRLLKDIHEDCKFIAVGKRGAQYLARTKRSLLAEFSISDRVQFHEVRAIADFALQAFLTGEVDTIEVLFPLYINTLRQDPMVEKLLPMKNLAQEILAEQEKLSHQETLPEKDPRDLLLEPSLRVLLETLPKEFFRVDLYHLLLEAKAAEQSARMVAMKTATDNAEEIAAALNLEYNKARQASITNEIIELTAAAAEQK